MIFRSGTVIFLFFSQLLQTDTQHFFHSHYAGYEKYYNVEEDCGSPLILTDLINAGRIQEARQAAFVQISGFPKNIYSYSGFFRVDEYYDSNLFFWFCPSQLNYLKDPVLLWLSGGPGVSAMSGLLRETSPFQLTEGDNLTLVVRNTSWTKVASVLYIDQPAGTGFSFTNNGFAENETKIATDAYNALIQFFKMFPELQSNDFYLIGECYGAKYAASIGHTILHSNPSAKLKINLKGLAFGDGWCVPEVQIPHAEIFYFYGFIDVILKHEIVNIENSIVELLRRHDYVNAYALANIALEMVISACGLENLYDYVQQIDTDEKDVNKWFRRIDIRREIHVGNMQFSLMNMEVFQHLVGDILQSVAPYLTELIDNYKVLFYNSLFDIMIPYSKTTEYLEGLTFRDVEQYKVARQRIWYYGKDIAGYVKTVGSLTQLLVRNSGHKVPKDQPEWALDMITRFMMICQEQRG